MRPSTIRGSCEKFALTGDMALRCHWETIPQLRARRRWPAPRLQPAAQLPQARAHRHQPGAGDNPRIRCEAYFALTANTVQFGAHAELYASAAGFSILGPDRLRRPDPARALRVPGRVLRPAPAQARLDQPLQGPRRGRARRAAAAAPQGQGDLRDPLVGRHRPRRRHPRRRRAPAAARARRCLCCLLSDALNAPATGRASCRPASARSSRCGPRQPRRRTLLHPLGTLTIKQTVVPLDIDISRFGSTTPGRRPPLLRSPASSSAGRTRRPSRRARLLCAGAVLRDVRRREAVAAVIRVDDRRRQRWLGAVRHHPERRRLAGGPRHRVRDLDRRREGDTRPSPPPGQTQTTLLSRSRRSSSATRRASAPPGAARCAAPARPNIARPPTNTRSPATAGPSPSHLTT